jgi:hypothetical protein
MWIRAVNTEAANTRNPSRGLSLNAEPRALNASTVIAAGGTIFSTKLIRDSLMEVFSPVFRVILPEKNKNGKTRQKNITAPMAKTKPRASFKLFMFPSFR